MIHSTSQQVGRHWRSVFFCLILKLWEGRTGNRNIVNKTGVINDPLGHTHSLAISEHCFHLKFVLYEKWGWTDEHMQKQWSLLVVTVDQLVMSTGSVRFPDSKNCMNVIVGKSKITKDLLITNLLKFYCNFVVG